MDTATLESRTAAQWDADIVPQLTEYIRIPAKSPHFDPEWASNGHIDRVVRLLTAIAVLETAMAEAQKNLAKGTTP